MTDASAPPRWDQAVAPWMDGQWLWFFAPGFVSQTEPVTIAALTHPDFRESLRYLGVPPASPVRLERFLV